MIRGTCSLTRISSSRQPTDLHSSKSFQLAHLHQLRRHISAAQSEAWCNLAKPSHQAQAASTCFQRAHLHQLPGQWRMHSGGAVTPSKGRKHKLPACPPPSAPWSMVHAPWPSCLLQQRYDCWRCLHP